MIQISPDSQEKAFTKLLIGLINCTKTSTIIAYFHNSILWLSYPVSPPTVHLQLPLGPLSMFIYHLLFSISLIVIVIHLHT